jgi:hypothetical protein
MLLLLIIRSSTDLLYDIPYIAHYCYCSAGRAPAGGPSYASGMRDLVPELCAATEEPC